MQGSDVMRPRKLMVDNPCGQSWCEQERGAGRCSRIIAPLLGIQYIHSSLHNGALMHHQVMDGRRWAFSDRRSHTHTHSTLRLLFLLPWSSFIFCVFQAGKLDQTVTAKGSGAERGGGRCFPFVCTFGGSALWPLGLRLLCFADRLVHTFTETLLPSSKCK